MTAAEMDLLLAKYFEPIYKVIGGGIAVALLVIVFFLIIYPFTNRRIR